MKAQGVSPHLLSGFAFSIDYAIFVLMAIDPQSLYVQFGRLAENMPDLRERRTASTLQWLGRAQALIAATDKQAGVEFDSRTETFLTWSSYDGGHAGRILFIFYRVLALAELQAPASVQGAFIPAGNTFDALAAVGKVLTSAKSDLLIVDPYMDEKVLTDFAPLASESVSVRLLADQASYKSTLRPASQRWATQFGLKRPLDVKLSPARTLHDRLIAVDGAEIWILTQSLNAFAARSPASLVRVDSETAALKVAAYQVVWDSASPL